MTIKTILAAAATLALLNAGVAYAQTPAPKDPLAATAKVKPAAKAKAPRTAKSLECSKEADTKNIHGKERKKFMSKCKKT